VKFEWCFVLGNHFLPASFVWAYVLRQFPVQSVLGRPAQMRKPLLQTVELQTALAQSQTVLRSRHCPHSHKGAVHILSRCHQVICEGRQEVVHGLIYWPERSETVGCFGGCSKSHVNAVLGVLFRNTRGFLSRANPFLSANRLSYIDISVNPILIFFCPLPKYGSI